MPLRKRLLIFIVLPSALFSFYYLILASDMFISETRFSLRSPEGGGSSELLGFLGQNAGGAVTDSYIVSDYILSIDMLQHLEKRLNIRSHFQTSSADIISRLGSSPTAEEFLEYYRGVVNANFDPTTGILTVKTRAYTPEMARDMGLVILEESELLVNQQRDRAHQDSVVLARSEVTLAEKRVAAAQEAMRQLRNKTNMLSPLATAETVQQLLNGLEGDLAKSRAELAATRTYMREDSPRVKLLKTRIAGLEQQIDSEQSRLTGTDGRGLSEMTGDFERFTLEHEFAQKQHTAALASLETARIRAESKSRYLVPFSLPSLPDESLYPKRLLFSGLAFAVFALIYGIVSLTIAAIREHAGF